MQKWFWCGSVLAIVGAVAVYRLADQVHCCSVEMAFEQSGSCECSAKSPLDPSHAVDCAGSGTLEIAAATITEEATTDLPAMPVPVDQFETITLSPIPDQVFPAARAIELQKADDLFIPAGLVVGPDYEDDCYRLMPRCEDESQEPPMPASIKPVAAPGAFNLSAPDLFLEINSWSEKREDKSPLPPTERLHYPAQSNESMERLGTPQGTIPETPSVDSVLKRFGVTMNVSDAKWVAGGRSKVDTTEYRPGDASPGEMDHIPF